MMRMLCRLLLWGIFVGLTCSDVSGQASPDGQRAAARLAALGKLWAAVEYFHPDLGRRTDIDWDAALIQTIPKVRAAKSPTEYAAAVNRMLSMVGDPVTQIVPSESKTALPARLRPPSYELTQNGVGLITTGDRSESPEYFAALEKAMSDSAADIAHPRGIVFDLRSRTPTSPMTTGLVSFALTSSGLANLLSSSPYSVCGEETRVPGSYQVTDERRIVPTAGARDIPIVFLIDRNSDLPPEMVSLQAAGKAAVAAVGDVTDAALVTSTLLSLPDGLIARVRLGELMMEDGAHRLEPDLILPTSSEPAAVDTARASAERIAVTGTNRRAHKGLPWLGISREPHPVNEATYPSVEYRLLAAFRIWSTVEYAYPYRELIKEEWDSVLDQFISRMEQAENALTYHLAVAEMVTHIHDSHGIVQSSVLGEYFGTAAPPIRLRMIEGVPVISGFRDAAAGQSAGAQIGDVVISVDGEPVGARVSRYSRYVAASTPQALLRDTLDRRSVNATTGGILFGPPGTTVSIVVKTRTGETSELKLQRTVEFARVREQRSGPILQVLDENIGYVDLDRLTSSMLDDVFKRFKQARAIIFDMRGYPRMMHQPIAGRLTDRERVVAALFDRRVPTPPGIRADNSQSLSTTQVSTQLFGATTQHYSGQTLMLIDERTQSAAARIRIFAQISDD